MQLASFIDRKLILHRAPGGSKKRVFELISQVVSEACPEIPEQAIFDGLFARERLGSTGIGEGVAVPHCRIKDAGTSCCALITLAEPIAFDAPDNKPVDILVALVVAGEARQEHLDRLAAVSRALSDASLREAIRACTSADELRVLILGY
jgi:nitrogen PTS system EIIA component